MRTIGLLGGMSWESTAYYYRFINTEIKKRCGGLRSAKLVLYSEDFAQIQECQKQGDWERAGEILCRDAGRVEAAGAECLLICTNTMHKLAERIAKSISIPLIHIADATAMQIVSAPAKKVGLLGTQFTMEQDFYRGRLESEHGLEVIVPSAKEREIVHKVIYEELCLGVVTESSRMQYQEILSNLVSQGAQGVILGCTEICMLVREKDCAVPLFDTTLIHAQAAVDFALG